MTAEEGRQESADLAPMPVPADRRYPALALVLALLTIAAVVTTASQSAHATPAWSAPEVIGPVGTSADPLVTATASGLVTTYFQGATSSWVYRRHTSGGWSSERTLSTDGPGPLIDAPAVVATDSLVRAVIPHGDPEALRVVQDDGTTLTTTVASLGQAAQPSLAVDTTSLAWVVGTDPLPGGALSAWTVSLTGTVTGPMVVSAGIANHRQAGPKLVIDSTDAPLMVWQDFDTTTQAANLRWSRFAAGAWSVPATLATTGTDLQFFDLAAGGTRAVVAWNRVGDPGIWAMTYANGGWGAEEHVATSGGGVNTSAAVAVSPSGDAAILMSTTSFATKLAGSSTWTLGPSFPTFPEYCSSGTNQTPLAYEAGTLVALVAAAPSGSCQLLDSRLVDVASGGSPTTTTTSPPPPTTIRLAGIDRIATAIAISQQSFPPAALAASEQRRLASTSSTAGSVVLVSADDAHLADGLVAAPLAVARDGPVLLTGSTSLDPRTEAEIRRVLPAGQTVYLLGGEAALGPAVESRLRTLGYATVRYAGPDRYATAVTVAHDGLGDPSTVLEANGISLVDALAGGAAAAHASAAVLLTAGSTMSPATASYLAAHPAITRLAVGGPAAQADSQAIPLIGRDRYETAVVVARHFFTSPTSVGLAGGVSVVDALAGGAHAGRLDAPLVLTQPDQLPAVTRDYLASVSDSVRTIFVYGGQAAA
jgi:ell wall binding domain 2 (CWB2)